MLYFFRNRWRSLFGFEKVLSFYWLLLSGLILLFYNNLQNSWHYVLLNILLLFSLFFLAPLLNPEKGKVVHFGRYFYIVVALPFLYWQVGPLLHLLHPGEFDSLILKCDNWLFGTAPNLWVQKYVNPPLTEIMQLAYSIYWITIPLGWAVFYFNRDYKLLERLLLNITITFFLSYLVFILFPVAGPRFFIADQITADYHGLLIADYLREFMIHAGYRGGAFPSSHVGVAVIILLFTWRFRPKIALRFFFPLVIALSLATVYGQYHYLTDVLAGLAMGIGIGWYGGRQAFRRFV